jgi:N-acetylglucosaminyldiphosphoundecaprenol N-acetyl-beta-D-mannosaminyltransferase
MPLTDSTPLPHPVTPSAAAPIALPPQQARSSAQPDAPRAEAPSLDRPPRRLVWGVPFDRVTMAAAVDHIDALIRRGEPSYVITANLNYVMLHHQQAELQPITRDADLILADGQPIVWRSRYGGMPLPQRVAGSELIDHLAERAAARRWGLYFLGGQPGVAQACAEHLAAAYPGMRVAGVESPPYRSLTPEEEAAQHQRIAASGAHLLLVAFGQPKGERWIHEHYRRLGVPVSIQLGASFDFIAGTAKRAPQRWQRWGGEWAYRMCSNPRRLAPRYAANAVFLMGTLAKECGALWSGRHRSGPPRDAEPIS